MAKSQLIAPGVVRVPTGIANAYLIGSPTRWLLIDTGTPGNTANILRAVEQHFDDATPPVAIILTHGHFDHAGSAFALAEHWGVNVYVHPLETPFVNGSSAYPPPDPTVGGFMAQVIRFVPNAKYDLRPHLRELEPGEMPWLQGWEIIETPGHTAGHVSLFRPRDRVLLAGDAFTTVKQDNMIGMLSQRPQVWRPPTYYTSDWQSARDSVRKLAALRPLVLGAGHGRPMAGYAALEQLQQLAQDFPIPEYGRYVQQPARSNRHGVTYVPPPVPDPVKRTAAIVSAGAAVGAGAFWFVRRQWANNRKEEEVEIDRAA
jgi:glyoxylase-like metal-dependent hydrolase (beta-lactamase superfamily II)